MRYRELSEQWVASVKSVFTTTDTDVFKNPSRQEVMRMINDDHNGCLRAIVIPNDLYVFSSALIHGTAADHIGLDPDTIGRILLDRKGPYITKDEDIGRVGLPNGPTYPWAIQLREQTERYCEDHPVLKRLFPNYVLEVR